MQHCNNAVTLWVESKLLLILLKSLPIASPVKIQSYTGYGLLSFNLAYKRTTRIHQSNKKFCLITRWIIHIFIQHTMYVYIWYFSWSIFPLFHENKKQNTEILLVLYVMLYQSLQISNTTYTNFKRDQLPFGKKRYMVCQSF